MLILLHLENHALGNIYQCCIDLQYRSKCRVDVCDNNSNIMNSFSWQKDNAKTAGMEYVLIIGMRNFHGKRVIRAVCFCVQLYGIRSNAGAWL